MVSAQDYSDINQYPHIYNVLEAVEFVLLELGGKGPLLRIPERRLET